ncbi:MAG: GNAT family N-acetyltransferase [Pseudomonadota bacterium]
MPIVTPRLSLRPAMPGDGAAVHEAVCETQVQLLRWMRWAREGGGSAAKVEADMREAYARFILRQDLMLIGFERDGGRAVVFTGLHRPDWEVRRFEIGYWVRSSAQGQSYATEAANALARYAFAVLDARRVEIEHADGNAASRAVAQKLGFSHEGTRRLRHALPDGSVVDNHHYVMLSPDPLPPLDVRWGEASASST